METKQKVEIGNKLLNWYKDNGRELPFRLTKDPYKIWICEIVFQQTRIEQGLQHYVRFVDRFPTVESLAFADTDEVMLYWKGLGYYSRALNLHFAANQIMKDFQGEFPTTYSEIIKLKGVGKYTAAAVASICFDEELPAVDGNFYRVLSRLFADSFDISKSTAFDYFSSLALEILPSNKAGAFNQAMMDLGSEVCKPKNPLCGECPLQHDCLAFQMGEISEFPVKIKKTKVEDLTLEYFFIFHGKHFLVKQRGDDFIWKKLFDFPEFLADSENYFISSEVIISHKLSHKNLSIRVSKVELESLFALQTYAQTNNFLVFDEEDFERKSFPKPLENYISQYFKDKI